MSAVASPAVRRAIRAVGPLAIAILLLAPPSPAQSRPFDHSQLDRSLHAFVADGLVDYDAFARSRGFARYLAQLAAYDPSRMRRDDQIAFWINAYNAYTIQLVNAHGERESIRNIDKTFGLVSGNGPWREKIAVVGGRRYSLDDIEQEILRTRFRDPRVHFALVCAALGCPPLRSEAYVGERLDAQLDDQATRFLVRSPAKNRVDAARQIVYLSPILVEFRDYIDDFGGSEKTVASFVARYYPPGPERALLQAGGFSVERTPYDWELNLKRPVAAGRR